MLKIPSLFAAGLLASTGVLAAQAPTPAAVPGKPAPTTAPVVPAAAAVLSVDDLDVLRAHAGQMVDVRGTPTVTGHSKSGTVIYLNFGPPHTALAVVAFLGSGASDPSAKKIQSEDELKPFVGKPVIIHGKVADYKGDLQIVLDSSDQIKLAP